MVFRGDIRVFQGLQTNKPCSDPDFFVIGFIIETNMGMV